MSEPPLIDRQRALLRDLARLNEEWAERPPALAARRRAESEQADADLAEGRETLRLRLEAEREALDADLLRARETTEARAADELREARVEHARDREALEERYDAAADAADAAVQEAGWAAETILEGARGAAAEQLRKKTARLNARLDELRGIERQARDLLDRWRQPAPAAVVGAPGPPRAGRRITPHIEEARARLKALKEMAVPGLLQGRRLLVAGVLLWLALVVPATWLLGRALAGETGLGLRAFLGATASAGVAGVAGLITHAVLEALLARRIARLYAPLRQALAAGEAAGARSQSRYKKEHDRALRDAQARNERNLGKVRSRQRRREEIDRRRAAAEASIQRRLTDRTRTAEERRADELVAAEARHAQGQARLLWEGDGGRLELDAQHRARHAEIQSTLATEWQALGERWRREWADVRATAADVAGACEALFPPWSAPTWPDWRPPTAAPDVLRIGSLTARAGALPEAAPWAGGAPAAGPTELVLPALCAFPEGASLLFHAEGPGRDRATAALQAVLFRLLTSVPPGRVRFTLLDPVGLGQNFATFMNLADHDEALVGGRIWTEAAHIEARLADLTAHMETVIQKYLRNRYPSITDYNAEAGEVAEPFRVLVVADFPVNFTAEAARRLVSIAQNGPRCGVTVLIAHDTAQPLPRGLALTDLEQACANLAWEGDRFRWRDPDFGPHALTLDPPPDEALSVRVLHQVGEASRGARRVEVPFEFVAPPRDRWWSGDARDGLSVALGRAGATRRQLLELGRGTSQHGLVVGKTGSGKSTLLHALITNLALVYAPDEVELYLIDFKKGVEFKTYATHGLPHARVIAIESEREFGLSVLRRLDAELTQRGERFRAVGAQGLADYRRAAPGARAPRVLLVVDEFQELFVEDDRLAQEAAQLLDRLVRQGRAFGLHVLLGSQTLAGAYSLARSTIDQMAVRIALQCSEADAHLVLAEDNNAARLLSRSGEAIYNDANGLVEGNDPFQVVWLSEAQREQYLAEVRALCQQRPPKSRTPTVIFEGNASADVTRNAPLNRLLAAPPAAPQPAELGWLGEAMAIDELAAAAFRRENGSHLLIVGQQPEAALGMLVTGVVSLAAHAPAGALPAPRFYLLDGHQADRPSTGPLALLAEALPDAVRLEGGRGAAAALAEVAAELQRRQAAGGEGAAPVYVALHGLHRFRDLRRPEDDFGFGGREQPDSPTKHLAALLREGPALGVHALIWCDTLNNLTRALDRQAVRELGQRVVFQLNVADSSSLIDSPAASKLGPHRALYASESDGRLEKFRPYGVPSDAWLRDALQALQARFSSPATPAGL